MLSNNEDAIRKVTTELRDEIRRELLRGAENEEFRPLPNSQNGHRPVWRIRLDMTFDSQQRVGLDINGEVTLGRTTDPTAAIFGLHDADQMGVSRRHAMLRPTESNLYLLDLGSTNGTWLNGHSLGTNTPYNLANGDIVKLGRLEFVVNIIKRPGTTEQKVEQGIAEALPSIARAITSQLEMEHVLKEAMDMLMTFTPAEEITIWLIDEYTGELFLEAVRGSHQEDIRRLPVADTLAGKVIRTGKPLRVHRDSGNPIKLKTGYLVEAVMYIPLSAGGVTFGVMSAVHRESGKVFTSRDEQMMSAIADFTAIALQNARLYRVTQDALTRHAKVVTALKYALSFDMKNMLNSAVGHTGLLQTYYGDDPAIAELISPILQAGDRMEKLITQLVQITTLCENPTMDFAPCDLVDTVARALDAQQHTIEARSVKIHLQTMGEPYMLYADGVRLYRSVLNLLDNAVKFTPQHGWVKVILSFNSSGAILQVCDSGPGIPEEDLPYLFTKYVRGMQPADAAPGLGLGLEFVRTTVNAHRGTVSARNISDGGAEFTVTLPSTLRMK